MIAQVIVFLLLLAGVIAPIILINLRGRDTARGKEPIAPATKVIAPTPPDQRNIQVESRMTPRDWFILGLRLFGVWEFLYGLSDALTTFSIVLHFLRPTTAGPDYYMSLTFMHFIAAFYLLKFAPQTAAFFYSPAEPPASDANPKE